jgi:hypothetical protein
MALEDTQEQPVRSFGTLGTARVTELSGFELCAERVRVDEGPWSSYWLKPVDVFEISQTDVRGAPPIPFRDDFDRPPVI